MTSDTITDNNHINELLNKLSKSSSLICIGGYTANKCYCYIGELKCMTFQTYS